MRTQIQKWGNSLALRIPKSLAVEAGLQEDGVVDLALVEGKLIVTPQPEHVSLEKLLAGITAGNLHDEQDFGGPVGREVW
jgi:antitoxin MazE